MKENLHFYDIKIDDMRAVTQKDIDTWTSMIKSYQQLINEFGEQNVELKSRGDLIRTTAFGA